MERKTGFEPATPTLARLCSTPELLPQLSFWWRDPESNRGHMDFQSIALPSELSRLHSLPSILMAGPTRLELATFGVTGRHSKPTELRPRIIVNHWWAKQGSNLRPPACKAGVLPLNYPPGETTRDILRVKYFPVKHKSRAFIARFPALDKTALLKHSYRRDIFRVCLSLNG